MNNDEIRKKPKGHRLIFDPTMTIVILQMCDEINDIEWFDEINDIEWYWTKLKKKVFNETKVVKKIGLVVGSLHYVSDT